MEVKDILSGNAQGHSIWLLPAQPEYEFLQNVIIQLSESGATQAFSPHITLLGQLKQNVNWLKPQMHDVFKDVKAFDISLTQVGKFDRYFRSIVLLMAVNPVLEGLHAQAKTHFKAELQDGFMPHLSLLYSNLEGSQKNLLMKDILLRLPLSIKIEAVSLVKTEGGPLQWQEILRLPLI
jgi:2'-5' RNA ligase